MSENNIGKVLRNVGIFVMILGSIGAFILNANADFDVPIILIAGVISSIITGVCFMGFGEIINLVQQIENRQYEMMKIMKENTIDK